MRRIEIESWQRAGRAPDLGGIVERFVDNTLQWSVLRIEGVCTPPHGLSYDVFQAHLLGNASGYLLGFADLRVFAATCRWTKECFVVAADSIAVLTAARLNQDFSRCAIVVQRAAHGRWSVWFDDDARLVSDGLDDASRLRVADAGASA